MTSRRLTLAEIHQLAEEALTPHFSDYENVAAIASTVTSAERAGSASHGLFRIPGYIALVNNGSANPSARPVLETISPSAIRVDGDGGFVPLAHKTGLPRLAELAESQGIAVLAITRSFHYGALWPEISYLTERGLTGMAMTSSPPFMAPHGGTRPFFGTNPMAFGYPTPRGSALPAMIWDQASSLTARGEIMMHLKEGKQMPDIAGLDAGGRPSRDPAAILEGAQLPFGGHKGNAIALMIDLLAGPLIGEVCSYESGEPNNKIGGPAIGGEIIIAMNPALLGGPEALTRAERMFDAYLGQEGARLPGMRRAEAERQADREGVLVSEQTLKALEAL